MLYVKEQKKNCRWASYILFFWAQQRTMSSDLAHRQVGYSWECCCSLDGIICSDLTASLEHSLLPLFCDNLLSFL